METNELHTSELTVIASEIKIVGNMEVANELHLYGQVLGKLIGKAGSIIYIKEGALVEGNIFADTLVIEGFVKGEVVCTKRTWITPNGKMVGSIHSPSLTVDPGAFFEAKVLMK